MPVRPFNYATPNGASTGSYARPRGLGGPSGIKPRVKSFPKFRAPKGRK